MKPIAKKSLLVIGVLYTIAVTVMITNFVMEAKPRDPKEVIRQLQEELTVIQHSAWQRDREHIRKKPITKEEATQVFEQLFPLKGSIININFTLILQSLNFGILLMILYGFLWDPLLQFLDKRRAIIRDRLEGAAKRRQEAEDALRQHQQELAQLRKQRTGIIEKARSTGQQEYQQIAERARREADRLMQQTQERLAEEARKARVALREEVAQLAVLVAARVLEREVSPADHEAIISNITEHMTLDEAAQETQAPPGPGGKQ